MQRYDLEQVNSCYTTDHEMVRQDDGEWVRYDDVATALAEAKQAEDGWIQIATKNAEDGLKRQAILERELKAMRVLAKEATNGWACKAKTNREHDEISRLHKAIDAIAV